MTFWEIFWLAIKVISAASLAAAVIYGILYLLIVCIPELLDDLSYDVRRKREERKRRKS